MPASPLVTLGAGFTGCSASAAGSSTTVHVTLSGGSCALPVSTAALLTVAGLANPAEGSIPAADFSVETSGDASSVVSPASAVVVSPATTASGVSLGASSYVASATSSWTAAFMSGSTGALRDGDTVSVVFPSGFAVPSSPTITLGDAFNSCSASGVGSSQTVTVR